MSVSINAICRKDRINQNRTTNIYLRFTVNRRSRYVSTGINIPADDWDFDTQTLKTQNPAVQLRIYEQIEKYDKRIKRLEALEVPVTLDNVLPGGGCLFPPRAFYKDANNTDIIRKYALKTDDIWLMFMAVQNDTKIIRTYQYHRTFILSEQEQTVQLGKEAIYQGRYIKTFYDLAKAYPHAYQNMLSEIAE